MSEGAAVKGVSVDKTETARGMDRERVKTVIGTYVVSQRDRGVLDEDIVAVLDEIKEAVLAQKPASQPAPIPAAA